MNEIVTSEPTTGEIVKNLRDAENPNVLDWLDDAAERLESQEREIERLRGENKAMNDHVLVATGVAGCFAECLPVTIYGIPIDEAVQILSNRKETEHTIAALTARAEQAERERDAAVAVIEQNAAWQKELLVKVKEINDSLRGLPQEGEWK